MAQAYSTGVTSDGGGVEPPDPATEIRRWARGWMLADPCRDTSKVWVYNLFGRIPGIDIETGIAPIYMGVTNNLVARMTQHSRKWWWCAVDLALSQAYGYATREEALTAEAEDIRLWHPDMNRAGRLAQVVPL